MKNISNISNILINLNNKLFGSGKKSLNLNNKFYINCLNQNIEKYNISSIIDIGCGNWEIYENINMNNINYLGIDNDENIIKLNLEKYGNDTIKFIKKDILKYDDIPKVDLFIIKDVIQEMSNDNIKKIIDKIIGLKPKLIIITSDILPYSINYNLNVKNGLYRPISLENKLFNYKLYNKISHYDKFLLFKYITIFCVILILAIKFKYKLYIFVLTMLIIIGFLFPKKVIYILKNDN